MHEVPGCHVLRTPAFLACLSLVSCPALAGLVVELQYPGSMRSALRVPDCGLRNDWKSVRSFGGSVLHRPSATTYQRSCLTGLTGGDPFVGIFGKYKEMRKQFVGEGRRVAARAKR